MRVYVAAPWTERHLAREAAIELISMGHESTHPWWDLEAGSQASEEDRERMAIADMEAVRRSDAVVVLNTSLSEGKATEQGMAIAWRIPLICVNSADGPKRSNIFHAMTGHYVHVGSLGEAIAALEGLVARA